MTKNKIKTELQNELITKETEHSKYEGIEFNNLDFGHQREINRLHAEICMLKKVLEMFE